MKVLLINGYANASHERYLQFKQHVLRELREVEKLDVTGITLVEKHRSDLNEYIFELHSENADPCAITRFDQLDFVFLDGDSSLPPWHTGLRKICTLVKMCMMTGKCLFGGNFSASILGYMCSTGGDLIHVMNNKGRGAPFKALEGDMMSPPLDTEQSSSNVLLDCDTGDFYAYNPDALAWEPKGNTGIVSHSSDRDRDYGARPNSARAGTRKRNDKRDVLYLSRLADIKCCGRLELQHHIYLKGLCHRPFLVNCPSKYDLDEKITCTSGNKYTVFVDSQRGPLLIEFGNALCAHFTISKDYPETCMIMHNFVMSKFELIKVHEHIDRSYMSSVSGMISDGHKISKQITRKWSRLLAVDSAYPVAMAIDPFKPPTSFDASKSGKTSPKKCRPFSATATKTSKTNSRPQSATPTMISGKRDQNSPKSPTKQEINQLTPSNSTTSTCNNQTSDTANEDIEFVPPQTKSRVKVCRVVNDSHKPYCAYNRFHSSTVKEKKAPGHGYYSVVNDGPYVGSYEKNVVENEKSKLKWISGPFRTAFGKASTHIHPEEGILGASDPYDVKNIPPKVIEPERTSYKPQSQAKHAKPKAQRVGKSKDSFLRS